MLKVGKQNLIIINLWFKFILNSKTAGAIRVVDNRSANEKSILEKNIPIIDLDECSSESNPDGFNKLSEEIGHACRDWGFFPSC